MEAQFVKSCPTVECLPEGPLVEVAFAGRSNCGKSSLINAATGRKGLARTSSTPGRTRELVLFSVVWSGEPFHLVDLPGYGYAKVSKAERALWGQIVPRYVDSRAQLKLMLVLSDIRRLPGEEEQALFTWCSRRDIEARLVLTKADKLNKSQCFSAAKKAREALSLAASPFVVSSLRKQGLDLMRREILDVIRQ